MNFKKALRFLFLLWLLLFLLVLLIRPISSITIEGNSYHSEQEILDRVMPSRFSKRAIVLYLKEKLRPHEEIPFVEKYTVEFISLQNIRIQIYEKTFMGYIEKQGSYFLLDWDGIAAESQSVRPKDLYPVTGLELSYVVLNEKLPVDESILRTVLTVSEYLKENGESTLAGGRKLAERAPELNFSGDKLNLILDDITVRLGTGEYMTDKLQLMTDILSELGERSGTLYLDSFEPGKSSGSFVFL